MRIALMTDIHANREAFSACLEHAERAGAERHVLLGDYVGYGADPAWVVEQVMRLVERGAVALLGNHDEAVAAGRGSMNANATIAANWTRDILSLEHAAFLRSLPLEVEEEDRLYVHGEASAPSKWHYVLEAEDARRSLEATQARLTFVGHSHQPRLFGITAAEKLSMFRPVGGVSVPLLRPRRWLAVVGAVGQPRDGDPAACYGMLDTQKSELTWVRVPYDAAAAAEKVRKAGLPEALAVRLVKGH